MFKQVFRIAFVTLIWKQYKHIIISTIVLFAFLFLVGSIHGDFLKHAELQGDKVGLGASFVYKWLAFAVGVTLYFFYHYWRGRKSNKNTSQPRNKQNGNDVHQIGSDDEDDPFNNIRQRRKLRSRADFLLEKSAPPEKNKTPQQS